MYINRMVFNLNKYLVLIVLSLLTTLNSVGQVDAFPKLPYDESTRKITYTDVVYLDSTITKQELYLRAREWFARSFKSATDVIKMENNEAGIIVGKGSIPVLYKFLGMTTEHHFLFTISLYFKDGRYKYEITDLVFRESINGTEETLDDLAKPEKLDYSKYIKKNCIERANKLNDGINALIIDIKGSMKKNNNVF